MVAASGEGRLCWRGDTAGNWMGGDIRVQRSFSRKLVGPGVRLSHLSPWRPRKEEGSGNKRNWPNIHLTGQPEVTTRAEGERRKSEGTCLSGKLVRSTRET